MSRLLSTKEISQFLNVNEKMVYTLISEKGLPATKITGGKYEALAISSRLATLLPEWGKELAVWHKRHSNQVRVSVQRPTDFTGPFQKLSDGHPRAPPVVRVPPGRPDGPDASTAPVD